MPTVRDVLALKGSTVHTAPASTTVLEATVKMNQHKIGALIVTNEDQIVGIFTERDVLRRVVAARRDPVQTTVAEVMTGKVICCDLDTDLDEVSQIMKDRRIRHLPACNDEGRAAGHGIHW